MNTMKSENGFCNFGATIRAAAKCPSVRLTSFSLNCASHSVIVSKNIFVLGETTSQTIVTFLFRALDTGVYNVYARHVISLCSTKWDIIDNIVI